jgi:transcriptional regulator with XRE-family HTH domain
MTGDAHLNELGEILKTRRAELNPLDAGLPDSGGRRVPGLRREEVARLAAISTGYYTRLEQGRIQPSPSVLATLARVLHLPDDRRDQLFELAGRRGAQLRRSAAQKAHPHLRRLLDDLTGWPGIVLGRRMDILAWNPLAAALFTDFATVPEGERNCVRILFTDPSMRTLHADWRSVARDCVSRLRMQAAEYPEDPRLMSLVGDLSVRDKDFGQWWASPHAQPRKTGAKRLHHPLVGELILDGDTLVGGSDPDQELIVWTAEAGTPSYNALRALASRQPAGPADSRPAE